MMLRIVIFGPDPTENRRVRELMEDRLWCAQIKPVFKEFTGEREPFFTYVKNNPYLLSCKSGISSENDTIARGRYPGRGSGLFLFDKKIADNLRNGQFFLFDNSQHFLHKRR